MSAEGDVGVCVKDEGVTEETVLPFELLMCGRKCVNARLSQQQVIWESHKPRNLTFGTSPMPILYFNGHYQ